MAVNLMIMGTMSSAGKSFLCTGLCRVFTRRGYRVAPFKSQNMALNSFVTEEGLEMGRAQVVQAKACGKKPSVLMNPVLLKPTTDVGSQIIVNGKAIGNMKARDYFEYKTSLIPEILNAYNKLASDNDIIIIEGAGSPAEINLKENDIVNMGLAKLLNAPVLLAGDIDPGGVFAQLYGTLELLDEDEKAMIKGLIINKFRGDKSLLEPGVKQLEDKCKKPVIGVVPMSKARIEEEDSITSAFNRNKTQGTLIDIAVIWLPRISNFTDFDVFKNIKEASLRFVRDVRELQTPDLIILPGTKNTISDLKWLKETGLFYSIKGLSVKIPVIGICGGFQMLGNLISDPLEIEGGGSEEGLGLINMKTELAADKELKQSEGIIEGAGGIFSSLNGLSYKGYEIHNGRSRVENCGSRDNVFGTYVHGIFDEKGVAEAFINCVLKEKGLSLKADYDYSSFIDAQFNIMADELEQNLDIDGLLKIMGI